MISIASLIVLLPSLLSLASAAANGVLTTYTSPDCIQAGGLVEPVQTNLPQDKCVNIPRFTSFQTCLGGRCPKQAVFTVYSGQNCQGTATDGGPVSLSYMNGPCQEVVLGAQSAILKCY